MKKYVVLPILWVSGETAKQQDMLEDLGIKTDVDIEDTEQRNMAFFDIQSVIDYPQNDKKYTLIYSGGMDYTVPLPFEEVLSKINNII